MKSLWSHGRLEKGKAQGRLDEKLVEVELAGDAIEGTWCWLSNEFALNVEKGEAQECGGRLGP